MGKTLDKTRIIRFHAALGAANLRDQKANLLEGYGVESTKDLTAAQADDLTARLNRIAKQRTAAKGGEVKSEVRRLRSVVMTLLNKLGIYATNGDWTRVNAYLLDKRIAGKVLYELEVSELKALNKKLRKLVRDKERAAEEVKFLETNN